MCLLHGDVLMANTFYAMPMNTMVFSSWLFLYRSSRAHKKPLSINLVEDEVGDHVNCVNRVTRRTNRSKYVCWIHLTLYYVIVN